MSIKVAQAEIERFLKGSEPETLCISGKWGVGKTYSWNFYLGNAKERGEIGLKRYAYVSLFGLKTLDELKYALFEATKPTERIGEEMSWDDVDKADARTVLEKPFRWVLSRLSRVPFIQNYIGVTESVLFYFVGKQLICIDDLERAGRGLDVNDVFGLVSFLKEQRKCRVVLLLNEEEIEKSQKEVFEKQFEKVVDTHLHFNPRPEEAAGIVFPSPDGSRKWLYEHCVTLGIKNIRVIKKVERIAKRIEEILGEKYPDLMYQAIHSSTLFAWSKYQKDGSPPPFEFLKDIRRLHGLERDKEKISQTDKKWQALMTEYRFMNVDDFDNAIHSIVESGVFDEEALIAAAEKQSQGVAKSKQEQVIRDTWSLYHGSFDDNEKEVMDAIFKTTLENLEIVSASNLDATVRTLKEFDRAEDANELIKKYVTAHPNDKELYDLKRNPFGSDIQDPEIRRAFDEKLTEFVDERNPADVLESMVRNRGWNLEDEELVDKLSVDDLYKMFKTEKGDRLHVVIKGTSMRGGPLAERANAALKKIGGENRLNARRVRSHGVKLEDE